MSSNMENTEIGAKSEGRWRHIHTRYCRHDPELGWACTYTSEELHIRRLETDLAAARAAVELLDRYCDWIRWRTHNGAVDYGELGLVELRDALKEGRSIEYPGYWVRNDEESKAKIRAALTAHSSEESSDA